MNENTLRVFGLLRKPSLLSGGSEASAALTAGISQSARAETSVSGYSMSVLRWHDEQRAADVLARAFVDDPLVMAICDAPAADRLRRMAWGFRVSIRSHWLAEQPAWVVRVNGAPIAVVLITRPYPRSHRGADFLFALRGIFHVGIGSGLRGMRASEAISAQSPPQPFTYLRTLGVDPDLHGRGFGSQLVHRVLETAPPTLPVYLETSKQENLSFYARHGFRCRGEFRCLGVPVWRLIRPPSMVPPPA
jgi:GNAT superfamily N-acetyltransferase